MRGRFRGAFCGLRRSRLARPCGARQNGLIRFQKGKIMTTLAYSAPQCAARHPLLHRFAEDLGMTVIVSTWAGVLITLVEGKPGKLVMQVVMSLLIGLISLLILDPVRLQVWDDPVQRRRWALPLLVLAIATAPLAHYGGIALGGLMFGIDLPALADYPDRRQLAMILFTAMGIGTMALLILGREGVERMKAERAEARTRAETVERQALQAQLRLLQAQIEPHMLFNTLANLQGLIAIDPARAGTMLDQLIQYLRATLAATRLDSTTLAQEFDAIDAYLGLMSVRMGSRLRYRCILPDDLRRTPLPPMLLQPLVENAIVHGLEPSMAGGEIVVGAALRGGMLEISVSDTGLGLPEGAGLANGGGGVGLTPTRERLHALYGRRASLALAPNLPQGTTALLTLPLESA
jgi:signal transduction histidine kinase